MNELNTMTNDVARGISAEFFPEEAAMFDDFVKEREVRQQTKRDDPFAFGVAYIMPFITPRILEACHLVGAAILTGAASVATGIAKDMLKERLTRWLQSEEQNGEPLAPELRTALGDEFIQIASAQLQLSGVDPARADRLGAAIVASMRIALSPTKSSS